MKKLVTAVAAMLLATAALAQTPPPDQANPSHQAAAPKPVHHKPKPHPKKPFVLDKSDLDKDHIQ